MNKTLLSLAAALACSTAFVSPSAHAVVGTGALTFSHAWTFSHGPATPPAGSFLSEILAYDSLTQSVWVAGVAGVDVLNARTGARIGTRIDTTAFGSINSVAISNGLAAFAIQAPVQTANGLVQLYDTTTRSLASGVNSIAVGALPDMVTFTPDGQRVLVANEGTPLTYGPRTSASNVFPRTFDPAVVDPVGTVSIIDVSNAATRSVIATVDPQAAGITRTGTNIRENIGANFEPEYIAVNAAGTRAYVAIQEANALGVLNLETNAFDTVIGLGSKDFGRAGNELDPLDNGTIDFVSVNNLRGLYQPDGLATYQAGGQTFIVLANEGDYREDDGDRSRGSNFGLAAPANNVRVSNVDSTVGGVVFTAGSRSFSIRNENGGLVYDSGSILDRAAAAAGIYNDADRSDDRGVEPEGIEVLTLGDRTYAFVGLERTTSASVAVFDITNPLAVSFVDLLVSPNGDISPEGLESFTIEGVSYIAFSNEVSNTTSVFALAPVPEPETYALMLAGLGLVGWMAKRKAKAAGPSAS